MIYVECEQGTPEWHQARMGIPTASKFRDALETYKGSDKPQACSVKYAHELAVERIAQAPLRDDEFESWQMRRGTEQEPYGRLQYQVDHGVIVQTAGICLTDNRMFGYSTDGLVEKDGLIEIKSLVAPVKLVQLWATGDLSEWMHQIQGGMWITEREWVDFICWAPQLRSVDKHLYVKRVFRDDKFINQMELGLLAFNARVAAIERMLRAEPVALIPEALSIA
jgi:exodeoxyribonuclease (lambda-induced)